MSDVADPDNNDGNDDILDKPDFCLDPTMSMNRDQLKEITKNKIYLFANHNGDETSSDLPEIPETYGPPPQHITYPQIQRPMALPMPTTPDGDYTKAMAKHFDKIYANKSQYPPPISIHINQYQHPQQQMMNNANPNIPHRGYPMQMANMNYHGQPQQMNHMYVPNRVNAPHGHQNNVKKLHANEGNNRRVTLTIPGGKLDSPMSHGSSTMVSSTMMSTSASYTTDGEYTTTDDENQLSTEECDDDDDDDAVLKDINMTPGNNEDGDIGVIDVDLICAKVPIPMINEEYAE